MRRLLALVLLCLLLAAGPVAAMQSVPASSSRDTVTLVSDTDAVAPGKPFRVGLYFRLAPGWHTYWHNPGDAGVAPSFDLTLPAGAVSGPIAWPTPRRIAEGPVMTYAYTGDVLLPVTITPPATSGPVAIQAHARWLVCKQICVPEEATSASTCGPARRRLPPRRRCSRHMTARCRGPRPGRRRSRRTDRCGCRARNWSPPPSPMPGSSPTATGMIDDDAAQPLSVRRGGFVLALKLPKDAKPDAGLSGILSVRDHSGLETDVELHATAGPAPPPAFPPLRRVLVFAFLGGLILNLMPCVFPILAMKAVALAQGAARGQARAHALFYTAGVLATFAALAGALLAARAAGAAAGWGFQFASPVFVAAMAWLLFGVGLNLSGVFEVGAGMAGTGSALAARGGHLGSFFTGLLAVLVATPCTAPFMSVAIAAGLAAPPAETLLVFLVMGLGLAAPYAAFSAVPALARLAPRPGRWMEVLKQGLAFPMYGAAAWLLWVVSQEAGSAGVLGTARGLRACWVSPAWVLGISQQRPSRQPPASANRPR